MLWKRFATATATSQYHSRRQLSRKRQSPLRHAAPQNTIGAFSAACPDETSQLPDRIHLVAHFANEKAHIEKVALKMRSSVFVASGNILIPSELHEKVEKPA